MSSQTVTRQKNKGGRPRKKHPGGRPRWDGRDEVEVLGKLRFAFDIGCTDEEAALHAGISCSTLYDYCARNPEFAEEKETRKKNLVLKSRIVIAKGIEGGDNQEFNARWYLERKQKDEFSTLSKTEQVGLTRVQLEVQKSDKIKSLILDARKRKKA